jgi:uncharacterized protein DUF4154
MPAAWVHACRAGPARALIALALLFGMASADRAHAQGSNGDAAVKAKFTVMLARFIQWPQGALAADPAPLQLCVLHNSPAIAAAFARHAGELVGGRAVSVRPNPAHALATCNVLFVDASAARSGASAIERTAGAPILFVGAVDGFAQRGGMVELVNVNDALRFDVNLGALRAAHLGLSSHVLKLARQVHE